MSHVVYESRRNVYRAAVNHFGSEHQLNKFDEELGEFLTEYGRMRNGGRGDRKKLAEELADLTIMLEQLRLIFDINDLVVDYMDMKVLRLLDQLQGDGRPWMLPNDRLSGLEDLL